MKTFRTEAEADNVGMIEVTHVLSDGRVTVERIPDDRPAPACKRVVVVNDENNERPAARSPRAVFVEDTAELWRSPRRAKEAPTTDGDLSPRARFARDTAAWWIPARARRRGFDG